MGNAAFQGRPFQDKSEFARFGAGGLFNNAPRIHRCKLFANGFESPPGLVVELSPQDAGLLWGIAACIHNFAPLRSLSAILFGRLTTCTHSFISELCVGRELFGTFVLHQRIDHVFHRTRQHLVEFVNGQPDAVIGNPILFVVVGSNFFAASTAANLALA